MSSLVILAVSVFEISCRKTNRQTIQYNSHFVYAKMQDKNRPVAYYRVNKSCAVIKMQD